MVARILSTVFLASVLSASVPAQIGVQAALLRPWYPTDPAAATFWAELNLNWAAYGSTPIAIDTTTFASAFDTASLLAADPDVVILSDVAGGGAQFTPGEISALQQFLATPGKRVIGTYATFFYSGVDNTALLPLFGIAPSLNLGFASMGGNNLNVLAPGNPLMQGLSGGFTTTGYIDVHAPADQSWDPGDYFGSIIATNSALRAIVHQWQGPTHDAVYMSFMPEYAGGAQDRLLMYNAVARVPRATVSLQNTPQIGTILTLNLSAPLSPNLPFVVGFSGGVTPGIPLPDGRVIPLNDDGILAYSLVQPNPFFQGTIGVLDAGGNAAATLNIANEPALVGLTLFAGLVTGDPVAPSGIADISPALPITFQ